MSLNSRKNDDLFPDWEFSEPDWLLDQPVSFVKENPAPPVSPAASSHDQKPDSFWDQPVQPTPPATSRHSARNTSWEQTRTIGHSHQTASRRHPAAPPPAKRRQRDRSRRSPLVIVLIVLLIGGMIFAGWQLGSILLGYQRDRSSYNQLASSALSGMAESDDRTIIQPSSARPNDGGVIIATQEEDIIPSEIPFTVDWDYLSSVNSDIVGWLYCPDTVINYPVVQSEDHDYYLSHGFEGQSSSSGTLFADRDSVAGIAQSHLIIYGHNMKDNSMFGTLKHYVDEDYFEEYPVFYYLTPEGSYRVELICSTIVESVVSNFPTYFSSTGEYQDYLDRITSSAYWVNTDAVSTDYQLMTFSTCTYGTAYDDARLLVHGMMIPIE